MRALLDDLQLALTDLMQTGLATAGADTVKRFRELSVRCESSGLHNGSELFGTIARLLGDRAHAEVKSDTKLTGAVCRAEHYITLCLERLTEDDIRARWQEGGIT